MRNRFLAVFAVLCAASCGDPPPPPGGPLVMIVEDSAGRPVYGADVRVVAGGAVVAKYRTGVDGKVDLGGIGAADVFVVDFQERNGVVYRPTLARVDRSSRKVTLPEGPPVVFESPSTALPPTLKIAPFLLTQDAPSPKGAPPIEHDATRGSRPRRFGPFHGSTRGAAPAPGRYAVWFSLTSASGAEELVPGSPDHVFVVDGPRPTVVNSVPLAEALAEAEARLVSAK